jgi:hypothetical protein
MSQQDVITQILKEQQRQQEIIMQLVTELRQNQQNTKSIAKKPNTIKTAKRMKKLRATHFTMSMDLQILKTERDEILNEKMRLTRLAEEIDEAVKNICALEDKLARLEAERKRAHFWNWKRKPQLDKEIEHTEQEIRVKSYYFSKNYHIVPKEAQKKISQIQEEIKGLSLF